MHGANPRPGRPYDEPPSGTEAHGPQPVDWVTALTASGPERERAILALHAILLRTARADAWRRSADQWISGPELDDIAQQAVDDALVAIIAKLGRFRGDSKFTTWAHKFVVFEVGVKINRHRWNREPVAFDDAHWDQLAGRLGMQPEAEAEGHELMEAVRRVVENDLTSKQRGVFVAIVVQGMPLDALAAELGSNRNAIYKVMFDARRKIRTVLHTKGLIQDDTSPQRPGGSR